MLAADGVITRLALASLVARTAGAVTGRLGSDLVSRGAEDHAAEAISESEELQWSSSKSIRTSVITLASFNVLAAAITIASILKEGYAAADRGDSKPRLGKLRLPVIGSWLVYPLVLSCAIVAQGIIFAVAQSRGLESLRIEGCVSVSQAMMPAIFLIPFLQLALGLETAVRALRRRAFPQRPKWVLPLCMGLVVATLLALYGVTHALKPPEVCYASLFWYTQQWRPVCLGLLVGVASTLLLATGVVFLRLRRGAASSSEEKMAASHMVYYMAVAVISNTLLTPFFFDITFTNHDDTESTSMQLSTVSSIVANLSGLMTGGLYLYLRGSKMPMRDSRKYNTMDTADFTEGDKKTSSRYATASFQQQQQQQQQQELPHSPPSPSIYSNHEVRGEAGGIRASSQTHQSSSDNTYPQTSPNDGSRSPCLLPSTTYAPSNNVPQSPRKPESMLMPPPLFHAPGVSSAHTRNMSTGSLETVQIGIRISNMQDGRGNRTQSRNSMRQKSPARRQQTPPPLQDYNPSPPNQAMHAANDVLNKELPHTPRTPHAPKSPLAQTMSNDEDTTQLIPAVYSPEKKSPPPSRLVSPKGVGFRSVDKAHLQDERVNMGDKAGWI